MEEKFERYFEWLNEEGDSMKKSVHIGLLLSSCVVVVGLLS